MVLLVDASFHLRRSDPAYPVALPTHLGDRAPEFVSALGNLEILQRKTLALFCSVQCPGNLIVQTYDLAHKLRRAGVTVMGGFHSPMERQCLATLLRSPHPVIVCPARSLPRRVPPEFHQPLEEGRLLLLSPFENAINRADEETARQRNRFVAALADQIFAAYAAPNSGTECFCREIIAWGKPLYTFADDANENLLALGAKPINPNDLSQARLG
jgi:predicted Rossmann fold nucleotide-binding protein DprA/Smf involved in DNA uptake